MTGENGVARATWAGVTARRMDRGALTTRSARSPAEVAGAMCGAHAQVLTAAELSIGRRVDGATRADVRRAVWEDRTLVKTFGPRGTVHLLASRDLPTWTGALSALSTSAPGFPDGVRLDAEQTDQVVDAIAGALTGAELTADELTEAVVEAVGPWAGELTMPAFGGWWPRWRQVMGTAAHRGALCFGPNRGRAVTYASPQRWLPGFRPAPGDVALRDLLLGYLRAYGPASPRHFARWWGVEPGRAEELFAASAADIERVDLDGEPSWVRAGDTAFPERPPRSVRLLPYFDAFVVAGQPRARLFQGPMSQRALTPSGQAGNYPVLLVDGVVAGVWHQRRAGRRLEITVEPRGALSSARRRALDDEVDLVGSVMEAVPRLTVGPVAVGPHA